MAKGTKEKVERNKRIWQRVKVDGMSPAKVARIFQINRARVYQIIASIEKKRGQG